jgi:hypothetical protein
VSINRRLRPEVTLGIRDETVFAGDHIAYFYETDAEFEFAFGFLDVGLAGNDHCIIFGVPDDTDRALAELRFRGWDTDALMDEGRLSILRPEATCDDTVSVVSAHFGRVLESGSTFIRFIGNAAVGHEGWPSEEEFYRLEAAVSQATLSMPCVAMCMFDLRAQPARTLMHAAFEGHPVTLHRNCVRENPFYVPRAEAARE